jgi:hypothetical protein
MPQLTDRALAIFAFAIYHELESGTRVTSVVADDHAGHRADPSGVDELVQHELAGREADHISFTERPEIVRDKGHIQDKWSEPLRTWFPEGKDDPQLALIRVHPERGEFWDSPSSTVIHLYGYVKAAVTGSPPHELSDNQKVDLGGGHASSQRS